MPESFSLNIRYDSAYSNCVYFICPLCADAHTCCLKNTNDRSTSLFSCGMEMELTREYFKLFVPLSTSDLKKGAL